MGKKKNNQFLVDELIDGLWTMDQNEFEQKYKMLNSSDAAKVAEAINDMVNEDEDIPENIINSLFEEYGDFGL